MLLDKKRNAELRRQKEKNRRTIFQVIWLVFAVSLTAAAVYVIYTMELFDPNLVYNAGAPREYIPEWAIWIGVGLLILLILQLLFNIGYMIGNPKGRNRATVASAESMYGSFEDEQLDDY